LSFLIALPFPITLSVIYAVVGHAILRVARHSSGSQPSYELVPLSSSAAAAAVGGAILTLPVILLLYFAQRLCVESSGPDDFFDDESDAGVKTLWRRVLLYLLVVTIAVLVGAVACPIGISILKTSSSPILSAAQGAAVATIGGALFVPLIVVLCVVI
jgi:hypothetical protein